jgi:predicted Rdx family selenoprotein
VKINDVLVFSKLEKGGFPVADEVIESIRSAQKGESRQITTSKKAGCSIL